MTARPQAARPVRPSPDRSIGAIASTGRSRARARLRVRENVGWSLRLPLLLLAAGLAGCGGGVDELRPLREGDDAPAYAAETLDGVRIAAPPAGGSPLLLNVWATWCAPCRQEMPGLQEVHDRYGDRLRVVGVSVDQGEAVLVREFVDELGITFPIVHDPAERVMRAFRTTVVPETFLIAADGSIRKRWVGVFQPTGEEAIRLIEETLADAAGSR